MKYQPNYLFSLSLCFVYDMLLMTKSFQLTGVVISQIGNSVQIFFQE